MVAAFIMIGILAVVAYSNVIAYRWGHDDGMARGIRISDLMVKIKRSEKW